jgi:hypothetical protein
MAIWQEDPAGGAVSPSEEPEAQGDTQVSPEAARPAEGRTVPESDPEIEALRVIQWYLGHLDREAQSRVIFWLAAKYRVEI